MPCYPWPMVLLKMLSCEQGVITSFSYITTFSMKLNTFSFASSWTQLYTHPRYFNAAVSHGRIISRKARPKLVDLHANLHGYQDSMVVRLYWCNIGTVVSLNSVVNSRSFEYVNQKVLYIALGCVQLLEKNESINVLDEYNSVEYSAFVETNNEPSWGSKHSVALLVSLDEPVVCAGSCGVGENPGHIYFVLLLVVSKWQTCVCITDWSQGGTRWLRCTGAHLALSNYSLACSVWEFLSR